MSATTGNQSGVDPSTAMPSLLLAFSTDPFVRWLFPQADCYHHALAEMILLGAGDAFEAGTVDIAHDGGCVAIWAPPGRVADDESYAQLFDRFVDPTRQADVFAMGEQVGAFHPPGPHWYLTALGVDPYWQGKGLGTAVLRRGLERCDRDGLPAYLESGNPRNRSLYERHGFEVMGEIQVADAPPAWPMLRLPRP